MARGTHALRNGGRRDRMKITCSQEVLNEALQAVVGVAPTRHARAILQNLKIEPVKGSKKPELDLLATDLEVGVRHRLVPDSVQEPEAVVLPAHVLAGIVREVGNGEITIETGEGKAVVKAGRSRFNLLLVEKEEYPDVPKFPEKSAAITEVPVDRIVKMISRTAFAVATEQSRYAINGIFLRAKGKTLELVATDGRRLARMVIKLEKAGKLDAELIVPPKMMREIEKRAAALEEGVVSLAQEGNQILAQVGNTTLVGRLVEGNYPKYQDVIPTAVGKVVEMDREELGSKLRQAQLLTSETSLSVTLEVSKGKVKIDSAAPERGDASLVMDVKYEGEKMSVAFNPAFLADVVKVIEGKTLRLELTEPQKPAVVRDGDEYVYVIMPVTVR